MSSADTSTSTIFSPISMDVSDMSDEETLIFTVPYYKTVDNLRTIIHESLNKPKTYCRHDNPYTCVQCIADKRSRSVPTLEKSQIRRTSEKCHFVKEIPKSLLPGSSSRFSDIKLNTKYLKVVGSGLSKMWPADINNVDCYWKFERKIYDKSSYNYCFFKYLSNKSFKNRLKLASESSYEELPQNSDGLSFEINEKETYEEKHYMQNNILNSESQNMENQRVFTSETRNEEISQNSDSLSFRIGDRNNYDGHFDDQILNNKSENIVESNKRVIFTPEDEILQADQSNASTINDEDLYDDPISNKRCYRYREGRVCPFDCKYVHRFPKDDGVLCKYFNMGYPCCDDEDCQYLHNRVDSTLRSIKNTKCKYFDPYKHKRCKIVMEGRKCSIKKCRYIHRLPKEDGVLCSYYLRHRRCRYGPDCYYAHDVDNYNTELYVGKSDENDTYRESNSMSDERSERKSLSRNKTYQNSSKGFYNSKSMTQESNNDDFILKHDYECRNKGGAGEMLDFSATKGQTEVEISTNDLNFASNNTSAVEENLRFNSDRWDTRNALKNSSSRDSCDERPPYFSVGNIFSSLKSKEGKKTEGEFTSMSLNTKDNNLSKRQCHSKSTNETIHTNYNCTDNLPVCEVDKSCHDNSYSDALNSIRDDYHKEETYSGVGDIISLYKSKVTDQNRNNSEVTSNKNCSDEFIHKSKALFNARTTKKSSELEYATKRNQNNVSSESIDNFVSHLRQKSDKNALFNTRTTKKSSEFEYATKRSENNVSAENIDNFVSYLKEKSDEPKLISYKDFKASIKINEDSKKNSDAINSDIAISSSFMRIKNNADLESITNSIPCIERKTKKSLKTFKIPKLVSKQKQITPVKEKLLGNIKGINPKTLDHCRTYKKNIPKGSEVERNHDGSQTKIHKLKKCYVLLERLPHMELTKTDSKSKKSSYTLCGNNKSTIKERGDLSKNKISNLNIYNLQTNNKTKLNSNCTSPDPVGTANNRKGVLNTKSSKNDTINQDKKVSSGHTNLKKLVGSPNSHNEEKHLQLNYTSVEQPSGVSNSTKIKDGFLLEKAKMSKLKNDNLHKQENYELKKDNLLEKEKTNSKLKEKKVETETNSELNQDNSKLRNIYQNKKNSYVHTNVKKLAGNLNPHSEEVKHTSVELSVASESKTFRNDSSLFEKGKVMSKLKGNSIQERKQSCELKEDILLENGKTNSELKEKKVETENNCKLKKDNVMKQREVNSKSTQNNFNKGKINTDKKIKSNFSQKNKAKSKQMKGDASLQERLEVNSKEIKNYIFSEKKKLVDVKDVNEISQIESNTEELSVDLVLAEVDDILNGKTIVRLEDSFFNSASIVARKTSTDSSFEEINYSKNTPTKRYKNKLSEISDTKSCDDLANNEINKQLQKNIKSISETHCKANEDAELSEAFVSDGEISDTCYTINLNQVISPNVLGKVSEICSSTEQTKKQTPKHIITKSPFNSQRKKIKESTQTKKGPNKSIETTGELKYKLLNKTKKLKQDLPKKINSLNTETKGQRAVRINLEETNDFPKNNCLERISKENTLHSKLDQEKTRVDCNKSEKTNNNLSEAIKSKAECFSTEADDLDLSHAKITHTNKELASNLKSTKSLKVISESNTSKHQTIGPRQKKGTKRSYEDSDNSKELTGNKKKLKEKEKEITDLEDTTEIPITFCQTKFDKLNGKANPDYNIKSLMEEIIPPKTLLISSLSHSNLDVNITGIETELPEDTFHSKLDQGKTRVDCNKSEKTNNKNLSEAIQSSAECFSTETDDLDLSHAKVTHTNKELASNLKSTKSLKVLSESNTSKHQTIGPRQKKGTKRSYKDSDNSKELTGKKKKLKEITDLEDTTEIPIMFCQTKFDKLNGTANPANNRKSLTEEIVLPETLLTSLSHSNLDVNITGIETEQPDDTLHFPDLKNDLLHSEDENSNVSESSKSDCENDSSTDEFSESNINYERFSPDDNYILDTAADFLKTFNINIFDKTEISKEFLKLCLTYEVNDVETNLSIQTLDRNIRKFATFLLRRKHGLYSNDSSIKYHIPLSEYLETLERLHTVLNSYEET